MSEQDENKEFIDRIIEALKCARQKALETNGSIIECHEGKLCRTFLDGTREYLHDVSCDNFINVMERHYERNKHQHQHQHRHEELMNNGSILKFEDTSNEIEFLKSTKFNQ
ncbi:MAG: hypothetical protein KDH96_01540 [Candidatus Riesia sp.]|nr:hypothetical protein [Candidatus Riesia sp.]